MNDFNQSKISVCASCFCPVQDCTCQHSHPVDMTAAMQAMLFALSEHEYAVSYWADGVVTPHCVAPRLVFTTAYQFPIAPPAPFEASLNWTLSLYGFYSLRSIVSIPGDIVFTQEQLIQYQTDLQKWVEALPDGDTMDIHLNPAFDPDKIRCSGLDDMLLSLRDLEGESSLRQYETPTQVLQWDFSTSITKCYGQKPTYAKQMLRTIEGIHALTSQDRMAFATTLLAAQKEKGCWDWISEEEDGWATCADEEVNNVDIPTWLATGFLMRFLMQYEDEALQIPDYQDKLKKALTCCYRQGFIGSEGSYVDGFFLACHIFLAADVMVFLEKCYALEPTFWNLMLALLGAVGHEPTIMLTPTCQLMQNLMDELDLGWVREEAAQAMEQFNFNLFMSCEALEADADVASLLGDASHFETLLPEDVVMGDDIFGDVDWASQFPNQIPLLYNLPTATKDALTSLATQKGWKLQNVSFLSLFDTSCSYYVPTLVME